MKQHYDKRHGFTLVEVLLVMLVVSAVAVLGVGYTNQKMTNLRMRIAAGQFQQIENAGLAYLAAHGSLGADLTEVVTTSATLYAQHYLTAVPTSPWGNAYSYTIYKNNKIAVSLTLPSANIAKWLVGVLPNAKVTGSTVIDTVIGSKQYVNNADAVNFMGTYHSGACVPVPTCPSGTTAQVLVAPSSATGAYVAPTCTSSTDYTTCTSVPTSSISGFVATAKGPTAAGNNTGPPDCATGIAAPCDSTITSTGTTNITSGQYWRVCLTVNTTNGTVNPSTTSWGQLQGNLLVMTRCRPTNQPVGSSFQTFQGTESITAIYSNF